MTSHTARLYSVALALVFFFLAWAVIAARPWATAKPDPRLAALAAREARLRHDSVLVRRIVARRWRVYRTALAKRKAAIAAANRRQAQLAAAAVAPAAAAPAAYSAPSVRVVTLPPLTITRTS
jgi:hypothetical protein